MKIIMQADDFGRSHEINAAIDHAIRNSMICSTSMLMGSAFTQEAVEMAASGGYLAHVHLHLNLSACRSVGDHFVPLNENYKNSRFCKDGEFRSCAYNKPDYRKYSSVFFEELETQYLRFKELTDGKANYDHVDFHLYSNFSPPVHIAYCDLIKKYGIQTARFFGEHDRFVRSLKKRLFNSVMISAMSRNKACVMKSAKIETFLMKPELFAKENVAELYVHPEYRDGVIIDRTNSAVGQGFRTLEEHLQMVRETGCTEFISWEDYAAL